MKKFLFIFYLILAYVATCQEDPLYSQYQFNQLMINPAYAGIYNQFSGGVISRFQWAGIQGAPRTNTITANKGLLNGKIGLGAIILNDRFGVSNNYEVQIAGSYNVRFKNGRLGMGLQGGYIQYGYDFSEVELEVFDDPEIMNNQNSFSRPSVGVGFMYLAEKFFIGFSVPRLLNVSVTDGSTSSERYKRHYYLSTGFVTEIDRTPLKVVSLIRSMNSETLSIDMSATILLDGIVWTGITLRDLKHFGGLFILNATESLQVGYSVEVPTNSLFHGSYGTHEVSLLFNPKSIGRDLINEKYF